MAENLSRFVEYVANYQLCDRPFVVDVSRGLRSKQRDIACAVTQTRRARREELSDGNARGAGVRGLSLQGRLVGHNI